MKFLLNLPPKGLFTPLKDEVRARLDSQLFSNLRLAGVSLAILLPIYQWLQAYLSNGAVFESFLVWFNIIGNAFMITYFFIGPKFIKNPNILFCITQPVILVSLAFIGMQFRSDFIRNDDLMAKVLVMAFMYGVISGASFVFTAARLTFPIGSFAVSTPLIYYCGIESGSFTGQILAISLIGYVLTMLYLSQMDYLRRRRLIETEITLRDEKELVEEKSQEIHRLKLQQDGDYYLTSLLLKPLSRSTVSLNNVTVHTAISQKKKFYFKNSEYELGGDMCIAHEVHLSGKSFTAFVNADAMGKSMQGAGGAIVLGAVFHSVVDRTIYGVEFENSTPERWLINVVDELQRVFVTFDGSMLISLFLGLLDNQTGFLYYLNAEHPNAVLYRKGRAEFILPESHCRKLGTPGMEDETAVSTFWLSPGDSIFVGSDGKDDIVRGTDENGIRIINEDERLILGLIEQVKGNITELLTSISSLGELNRRLFGTQNNLQPTGSTRTVKTKQENYFYKKIIHLNRFTQNHLLVDYVKSIL